MVGYLFAYLFFTFPEQENTHVIVTRCLGDLVKKPDKMTTTNETNDSPKLVIFNENDPQKMNH